MDTLAPALDSTRSITVMSEKLRLDKWLVAARFYKTRNLASTAIAKNQVRVNGQKVKASRTVALGDEITVEKPPYRFVLIILGLSSVRKRAAEAQLLYEESEQSVRARAELRSRLRADRAARLGLAGAGKPNKRERRQIMNVQRQGDFMRDEDE